MTTVVHEQEFFCHYSQKGESQTAVKIVIASPVDPLIETLYQRIIHINCTLIKKFSYATTMLRYVSARISSQRTSLLLLRNSARVTGTFQQEHAFSDSKRLLSNAATSFQDQGIHNYRDPPAPILQNCEIDLHSETYLQAMERTKTQVAELNQRIEEVTKGGGPRAVEKHLNRNKLLARDRMHVLCDPGTPLLELSALAGTMDGIPSGGIVTAIGMVSGKLCMMIANDATVKGGTYFPITVKKHLRAQEIAMENNLPCIYLVDSGGAFLPEQAKVFPDKEHFGRIFFNQANMSAQGIPQVAGEWNGKRRNVCY